VQTQRGQIISEDYYKEQLNILIKNKMVVTQLTGYRWWEQKNPSYREACRRQATNETIELKGQYDYFIKNTK
jgi:hypothetical protein